MSVTVEAFRSKQFTEARAASVGWCVNVGIAV